MSLPPSAPLSKSLASRASDDLAAPQHPSIFEIALASIPDFAYIFDLEGRFRYINKALLDLWGLTLSQAVGKNFYDLNYPEPLASKLHRQIQQVIETGQGLSDETSYTSPSGVEGYYEYIFTPVFGADGRIEAVAGCTRVITHRKWTETLIDAQRQSLEMVASGRPLSDILSLLTLIVEKQSGGESIAAILLLNEAGLLRIGAAPSLPDEYNRAIDGIKPSKDLGTCSVAAVTGSVVMTPDIASDPKWQSIKHLPLGIGLQAAWSRPIVAADGRVLGTFGTYFRQRREPTALEQQLVEILSHTAALAIERRQADEEREHLLARERSARAEADAANRAKDKFLAVLSHELRTPLSPVVMTIPVLESDPAMPAKFREDLAMVRRNIELEVKLIDDLLDLSRVTSGKLRLQMQGVHVHKVLLHAVYNSSGEAAGKAIAVRQDLHASQDLITADPGRLQQVFWNLLRNSVKFTARGGDIVVRTWNEPESGRLFVEVRDTGVGISAEALPRIFEAFEQGDAQSTGQFGGLGLGLAIAKVVVEIHGGAITASSDGRGKGACFTVALPLCKAADNADPASSGDAAPKKEPAGQTRLLLVEDHHDTARTLARLLNGSGYIVKTAHSVASALELAETEPFDILVSDIGLPDASGYELMEQIKARYGIKGIALSGYGMEDDVNRSRAAGFIDHVTKPVNVDELEAVIERVRGVGS